MHTNQAHLAPAGEVGAVCLAPSRRFLLATATAAPVAGGAIAIATTAHGASDGADLVRLHRELISQTALVQSWNDGKRPQTKAEQEAALRADAQAHADREEHQRLAKPSLVAIGKLKATTAPGIYAKAAVVRASKAGTASLAMSLAEDLMD